MKLLVSVADVREARVAVRGGVDIVDVKNPAEGSLGAPAPGMIARVRDTVPRATYGLSTIVARRSLAPKPSSKVRKTTSWPFRYARFSRISGSHDRSHASPADLGQSCMSWHASGVRNA